jgi:hypothetical protein
MNDEALAHGAGLRFVRRACSKCGAANEATASTRCRPVQDETGEYTCPAGEDRDADGFFLEPSVASLREMDAAIDRVMAKDTSL